MRKNLTNRKRINSSIISVKSFLVLNLTACLLFVLSASISASDADTTEWRQLFNGKDLTGWKQVGPGTQI
ncbi:MAG TPA: hypothetical protein VMV77_02880 [Bacteroidales bacterium]|nr:hypothetical protein [Bacteroidales bacterium]